MSSEDIPTGENVETFSAMSSYASNVVDDMVTTGDSKAVREVKHPGRRGLDVLDGAASSEAGPLLLGDHQSQKKTIGMRSAKPIQVPFADVSPSRKRRNKEETEVYRPTSLRMRASNAPPFDFERVPKRSSEVKPPNSSSKKPNAGSGPYKAARKNAS